MSAPTAAVAVPDEIAELEQEVKAATDRRNDARAQYDAARARGSQFGMQSAAETLAVAEPEVARCEQALREARLVPAREEWERLEREDERDAERLEAALRNVVAPILRTMMLRYEDRQTLAMRLGLGVTARHREAFSPNAAFWTGLSA